MAIPTFVAAGTAAGGQGAITPGLPSGWAANDIHLLLVESDNEAVSAPSGYTEVTDSPQGTGTPGDGTATRLSAFWRRAVGGDTAPTVADSGDHTVGVILGFRGCATSGNPWDVMAGGVLSSASTSFSITGLTTTVPDCLVVAIVSNGTDTNTAQASGWTNASLASLTERFDANSAVGGGGGISVATGEKASAGSVSATTGTLATASKQGFLCIALKEQATGPQTIYPSSVASPAAFGTPKANLTIYPSSVASPAAFGTPSVLQYVKQILTRRFNAYLRFSSYKYGINEEYRAAAWHTPLLVDIPEPEERLKDDYGIIQADELSVEVADTALRAVLEGGSIVGAAAVIEQVLSLTYTDGTSAERATTRGYTVTAYQYRPGTVTLELADLEVERLEALYPAALYTAADFSAILADSINKPVPVVVGSAKLVPCTQVDAAVKVFACCLYSASQTITAVYRNGRLVNSGEYTVGSQTFGSITVKKITFTREQIDFSGNNYKLEADITGSLSGNAVTELARILAAAGMTTDSTSFTAGESVATTNKMLVGWAYSAQRTFSAIVRELCLIARASLRRNDAGAWVLVQDVSQTAAASYDAETDLVEIDSYDSGKPPDTVELAFGTNPLKNNELAYTLTRDGGGATGAERYTAAMLQDKEGGDRLCCYLAQREKHCATSRARIHDDAITLGSRLTLTAAAVWSGAKDWIVRGIRRGAGWADCDLREYHADVYTYVSSTLPTSPSTGYGSTPATPSAPSAAQGTGKTIRVALTALDVAPARYYIYRSAGGGAYTKVGEISGTEWVDTNVSYGTAYLYKASAVDAYLNESAQSSASGSVTPSKITASNEVAAGTVGNTELGTNAVGNSNIQDSAVDTAEIAAAAVSATTSASTDGSTGNLTVDTQTTVQSLAVTTEGGAVLLDFGCVIDLTAYNGEAPYVLAALLRDSTTVVSDLPVFRFGNLTTANIRLQLAYNDTFVDSPSSGSYTYYLKLTFKNGSSSSAAASKRIIRATELKK